MKHPSSLAICHFAFLSALALYLALFYPECRTLALLLVLSGAAVEFWPRIFQRLLVPELLIAVSFVVAWAFWSPSATRGDLHRAVGFFLAYLLLIPSRKALNDPFNLADSGAFLSAPGRLKWLVSLVILELIFGCRFPGTEIRAMLAIAIGLLALAMDSWLASRIAARPGDAARSSAGASLLRWAILPFLLVAAATTLTGTWVVETTADYHAARQITGTGGVGEDFQSLVLLENMSLGDHRSLERDPRIVARLTWDSGAAPTDTVYLRAVALPDLVLHGPVVAWLASPDGDRHTPSAAVPPHRWAYVNREASRSEIVLRPDEDGAVDLPEISSDDTGNLYSAALRNRPYTYRTAFDGHPFKADPATIQRYLEMDPSLASLPWERIDDPCWRFMLPEDAAALICSRLQAHCGYDMENLPAPMDGLGGVLRGFLFGATPQARRGHCQYFASSAVLLLRRAGHPARCVGGFASDEIDFSGVTFRGLHFHSWIEVINSQGEWQRFDPSPDSRRKQILTGVTLPSAKTRHSESSPGKRRAASQARIKYRLSQSIPAFWVVLIGAVAMLCVLASRRWTSRAARPRLRDPRLIELQRRNDDLIQVATELGIVVTPATTLSDLVASLEAVTHVPLATYLQAHLAARFGQGSIPPPWPVEAIANARKANPSRD